MSRHEVHLCDLTGEILQRARLPIVIRISAAVVPGAARDPHPDELPPALRALFFRPDGRARHPAAVELGAEAFARMVTVNQAALEEALDGDGDVAEELQRLREARPLPAGPPG